MQTSRTCSLNATIVSIDIPFHLFIALQDVGLLLCHLTSIAVYQSMQIDAIPTVVRFTFVSLHA
jgi:hypothetical protein